MKTKLKFGLKEKIVTAITTYAFIFFIGLIFWLAKIDDKFKLKLKW